MCETFHTAAGQRKFNVTINGTQVLPSFDIFAAGARVISLGIVRRTIQAHPIAVQAASVRNGQ